MPKTSKPQILLTNDDGIQSPGLWAAAGALAAIGRVTVAAPAEQSSGMGRSLPSTSSGIIREEKLRVNGQEWVVYAVSGSPAQAVQHAVLEIMPKKPDLVVSGINYGENVGLGTTISGTVGAAMEAASLGIPALAISLEAAQQYHLSYSSEVDFSVAADFAAFFGRSLLTKKMPRDVDLLKVDVPSDATPETLWLITRVARQGYYEPLRPKRSSWKVAGRLGYKEAAVLDGEDEDSDVVVLRRRRQIAVTPISLDMTSRIDLSSLERHLRK
ncbi:MAG: 5'/3'-nucleotidase SurE [Chloroflexota bacterium]